jgi:hypothetical protein
MPCRVSKLHPHLLALPSLCLHIVRTNYMLIAPPLLLLVLSHRKLGMERRLVGQPEVLAKMEAMGLDVASASLSVTVDAGYYMFARKHMRAPHKGT